jgi:hypothetical protein
VWRHTKLRWLTENRRSARRAFIHTGKSGSVRGSHDPGRASRSPTQSAFLRTNPRRIYTHKLEFPKTPFSGNGLPEVIVVTTDKRAPGLRPDRMQTNSICSLGVGMQKVIGWRRDHARGLRRVHNLPNSCGRFAPGLKPRVRGDPGLGHPAWSEAVPSLPNRRFVFLIRSSGGTLLRVIHQWSR